MPLDIDGVLGLEGNGLRLNTVHLSSAENSLTVSGVFRQTHPLEGEIQGEVRAATSLAETLGLELPVQGAFTGPFHFEALDSALRGRVELASSSLMIAGTGPWTVAGTARLQEKAVFVEPLNLRGYGGSVESQGRIDLAHGNIDVRLQAAGIDLNALAATWTNALPQLAARAGAEVDVSLEDWQLSRARGKGRLTLAATPDSGLPLAGRVDVELEKERLHILSEGLRIAEGSVRLKAALDKRGVDAQYELEFPASGLQNILSTYLPGLPRASWGGALSASGSVKGAYSDLSATSSIKSEELTVQSKKIDVAAELEWGKAGLLVQSAQVGTGPGNLKIQGTLPLAGPTGQWDLSGAMESFDLSPFVQRLGFSALADGSLAIQGPARAPDWTADLKVSLEDRERASRQATVSLQAHGQKDAILIDELRAEIGGGSLAASGSYRLDSGEMSALVSGSGIRLQDVTGLPESLKNLDSVLSLDGDLSGKPGAMQGRLGLELDDLSVHGSPLPKQSLDIRLENDQARFTCLAPLPYLTGSCRLQRPYALQAKVDLSPLPYNVLLAAFPALSKIKIASAAGGIQLDLDLEDLSGVRWRAEIDEIKGSHDKQELTIGPCAVEGGRSSLHLSGFRIQGPYSSLSMDGTLPLSREGMIDLKLDGQIGLEFFSIFFPALDAGGSARLGLHIQGTRSRPVLIGGLAITQGSGRFRGQPWENLELRVQADKDQVRVETLSLQVLGGAVKANGILSLIPESRGGQADFEWDRLDAGLLLSPESNPKRPSIRFSGKGRLAFPEFRMTSLNGKGQITEISTNLGRPPISLQNAVDWIL